MKITLLRVLTVFSTLYLVVKKKVALGTQNFGFWETSVMVLITDILGSTHIISHINVSTYISTPMFEGMHVGCSLEEVQ